MRSVAISTGSSSVSGDLRDRFCAELSDRRMCGIRRSPFTHRRRGRHGSSSVVESSRIGDSIRRRVVSALPPRRIGGLRLAFRATGHLRRASDLPIRSRLLFEERPLP